MGKDPHGWEYTSHDLWKKKLVWKSHWKKIWRTEKKQIWGKLLDEEFLGEKILIELFFNHYSSREEANLEGRVGAGMEDGQETNLDQGEEANLERGESTGVAHRKETGVDQGEEVGLEGRMEGGEGSNLGGS